MTELNPTLARVTERIQKRSAATRQAYLARIDAAADEGPLRKGLSCTNLAHGFAAAPEQDKTPLQQLQWPNIAIVSAYNDILSAHQPLVTYPELIKQAAREVGATAQFAGGVPAMCDGVTQGQPGMELSLFSRDVIAMATAVALSHNMFDGALCLGVCDKIVPGLLMGALAFGHLPVIFVPGGPMPSGLPNQEKARIRQLFAQGQIGREELLKAESASYHSPGTCTFYGTANSNQMLMEVMGLHLPGAAFPNPDTPLRYALTAEAARRVVGLGARSEHYTPVGRMLDERSMANAIVGLLATGGSTNHTMHLVAIARVAGILLDWDDFDALSGVVPLLTRMYPNGEADVNQFHAAGGMGYLIRELLDAGLLHEDVATAAGRGLRHYTREPFMDDNRLTWREAPAASGDDNILRPASTPFDTAGGLRLLNGNLGRAIIKLSAVAKAHHIIEAPARVFASQDELLAAFARDELNQDMVAVLPWQGPRARGMPELHKLSPTLAVLQDRGYRVALVTDGRMSGASGKVPAAIQVTPEAACGGALGLVRDGDPLRVDGSNGRLELLVAQDELAKRRAEVPGNLARAREGMGRELFANFRGVTTGAEQGAMSLMATDEEQE